MSRIAFIGLGNMGWPMAENLARAGHDVVGFDVVPATMTAWIETGRRLAGSVAGAVEDADVVVTMLPAGRQVAEVYLAEDGILAAQKRLRPLLIDSSTIDVATARRVAAAAAEAGLEMLDAPVSGGTVGAAAGTLTFMVGGSEAGFAAGLPLLQNMGKTIVHAGAAGAGQAAKICNNMILGISMIGVAEAFVLADKLGLDRQKLFDISSTASGQCWAMTTYCPVPGPVPTSPANRGYAPGFASALMLKDLTLAQQAAREAGAATPLGRHAAQIYAAMAAGEAAGRDFSFVYRWLSEQAQQEVGDGGG
jgi:3-hydroxyisobutyrate dehydrogenase